MSIPGHTPPPDSTAIARVYEEARLLEDAITSKYGRGVQSGFNQIVILSGNALRALAFEFPYEFVGNPVVMVTNRGTNETGTLSVLNETSTGFTVYARRPAGASNSGDYTFRFSWLAHLGHLS